VKVSPYGSYTPAYPSEAGLASAGFDLVPDREGAPTEVSNVSSADALLAAQVVSGLAVTTPTLSAASLAVSSEGSDVMMATEKLLLPKPVEVCPSCDEGHAVVAPTTAAQEMSQSAGALLGAAATGLHVRMSSASPSEAGMLAASHSDAEIAYASASETHATRPAASQVSTAQSSQFAFANEMIAGLSRDIPCISVASLAISDDFTTAVRAEGLVLPNDRNMQHTTPVAAVPVIEFKSRAASEVQS